MQSAAGIPISFKREILQDALRRIKILARIQRRKSLKTKIKAGNPRGRGVHIPQPLRLPQPRPDELVRPLDEVLHIRSVGVASVMLPPRQLPIQQRQVHGRHLRGVVIAS